MKKLKFIKNWNNKLNCDFFTTIRYWDNISVDDVVEVELEGKYIFSAKCLSKKHFHLDALPEMTCYTDFGANKENFIKFINKMYGQKVPNILNEQFTVYLFERLNLL